jgi:hypothetical protein
VRRAPQGRSHRMQVLRTRTLAHHGQRVQRGLSHQGNRFFSVTAPTTPQNVKIVSVCVEEK